MVFQDYYKILEVDYDATEDTIRSNYIRLALVRFMCFFSFSNLVLGLLIISIFLTQKWHPDKQKDQDSATSRFQDINEAYQGIYLFIYCALLCCMDYFIVFYL